MDMLCMWSWWDTTEGIKDRNKKSEALATFAKSFKLPDSIAISRAERRVTIRIGREARLQMVEEEAYQGAFYTQL